jgi:uncharacterized protein (DUF1800 family)
MRILVQGLLFGLAALAPAHAATIFSSGFEPPFNLPANAAEAARFLTQASFGPTPQDIARVQAIGYVGWLHQQFHTPPTRARPHLEQIAAGGVAVSHNHRMDRWFHTVVYAPDQLRQRMAFALSQILVLSDRDASLSSDYFGVAEYWDLLATHAFGNYRDLMRAVSLSPQMARYLTFLRNRKGDPASGRLPDENYARELMQLFTIGLIERNDDFSPVLDAQGRTIPTYDQATIMELARVFTALRHFVWNPTVTMTPGRRARWACVQAAGRPVHMSTRRV